MIPTQEELIGTRCASPSAQTAAPRKAATVALSALGVGAALPAAEVGGAAVPWSGVAAALAPIAKRYGVKALEGMSLGAGYEVYRALGKYFAPGE